jgi:hypothetical protein
MIPILACVRIRIGEGRGFQLWLPLFLLWLVMLPLLILISPFFLIACLVLMTNPLRWLVLSWEVLSALRGTLIDVDQRGQSVYIKIF